MNGQLRNIFPRLQRSVSGPEFLHGERPQSEMWSRTHCHAEGKGMVLWVRRNTTWCRVMAQSLESLLKTGAALHNLQTDKDVKMTNFGGRTDALRCRTAHCLKFSKKRSRYWLTLVYRTQDGLDMVCGSIEIITLSTSFQWISSPIDPINLFSTSNKLNLRDRPPNLHHFLPGLS